jgi:hypothetical protein
MFKKIEKLYFNKSFSDVTTQDIADLFWINKASLYYYFESKVVLFKELLEYSFENFKNNLNKILKKDIDNFIKSYLNYASESQNLFAVISQNWACKRECFIDNIIFKQKEIFEIFYNYFSEKYWFSKEKIFILFSLIDSLSQKKCATWWCIVEIDNLLEEIKSLFIK